MNKKMYIAPETTCIAIEAEKMLAASAETVGIELDYSKEGTTNDFGSREDNSTRPSNNPWDQAW